MWQMSGSPLGDEIMRNRPFYKRGPDARAPELDIIYGAHSVEAALRNKARQIKALWLTKNALDRLRDSLGSLPIEPEVVHPRSLDNRLGPDAVHQGLLIEALPLAQPRLDQIPREGKVVILDQVTDPHNVGAILRSCAAFGVRALVTTARHSPEASGVLFKAASGAMELVPFVKVTNLARAIEELKSYSFRVIGLDSETENAIEDIPKGSPLALVLGAEGRGLRQLTRRSCDELVRLDLPGPIKSLNVSNACALALYAVSWPS
jgi:23S rRNA (guanosine2251-2'-O)-methyltransferase